MTTIRDVAQEAGVHPSTVSRVFSGKAKISPETCARVQEAAAALNFHPNAIARSLSEQRTRTIAAIVPHLYDDFFEDAFFPQVMRGLLDAAHARGYRVLVSGSHSHQDETTQILEILASRQADGVVVLSSRLDVDTVDALRRQNAPFVLLGSPVKETADLCWVDADNRRATRRCVRHLISLGHGRIAFVGGDPEMEVVVERQRGYREAMEEAGLPLCSDWIDHGYFVEDGGYRAVERMLTLGADAPTAYYAANDLMAFGILRALREQKIAVPEQVSVIGTNDSPAARHSQPALTSLAVPYAEMAAEATRILFELIDGGRPSRCQQLIASSLVIRNSCGPPPAGDTTLRAAPLVHAR